MSNIRKWIKILHRDIGYLAAGLTIIYAISGVAVNHVDEWNPNYSIKNFSTTITPSGDSVFNIEKTAAYVLQQVGETGKIKSFFRPDPDNLQIFVEGNTLTVDLKSWTVHQEKVTSRSIIRETNFLHLNAPKKVWTYVADIFAVALALLAVTGLFMIKGKNGIKGRGAWLSIAGLLIPILFLIIYYY
jgi:uncharacterized protein